MSWSENLPGPRTIGIALQLQTNIPIKPPQKGLGDILLFGHDHAASLSIQSELLRVLDINKH